MNLLLKITELVDKDIAENSKPISLIGAIIPWVPFMFFVEGAPMDTHPTAAAMALGVSIGWLLFVLWRLARYTRNELAPYHKSLGPSRFWALMAGTMVAIGLIAALLTWLEN